MLLRDPIVRSYAKLSDKDEYWYKSIYNLVSSMFITILTKLTMYWYVNRKHLRSLIAERPLRIARTRWKMDTVLANYWGEAWWHTGGGTYIHRWNEVKFDEYYKGNGRPPPNGFKPSEAIRAALLDFYLTNNNRSDALGQRKGRHRDNAKGWGCWSGFRTALAGRIAIAGRTVKFPKRVNVSIYIIILLYIVTNIGALIFTLFAIFQTTWRVGNAEDPLWWTTIGICKAIWE